MKRYHSLRLLTFIPLILLTLIGVATAQEQLEEKTDFIRVTHLAENSLLQTGITRYVKDGVTVDFIGAVHIADKVYYQQLNDEFKAYQALLFEMVGGEKMQKQPHNAKAQGNLAKKKADLQLLGKMYETMMKKLELSGQQDWIDYSADNFIHADLTLKEFYDLQKKKKESILKLALQNAQMQAKLKANGSDVKQPSTFKLLLSLVTGNADGLKMAIVDSLGAGDDQIQHFAGSASVIIGDRNAKCIKVMQEQINAGTSSIGIFYGAAHFPDLEERIIKLGFKKTNHRWLNAWDIKKKKRKKAKLDKKKAA